VNFNTIIVMRGFNGGWKKVVGPISRSNLTNDELVNLPASKYSNPVLSWKQPVGVTQIEFLKSSKLGHKYENNIFVGDYTYGIVYNFKPNASRTGLMFDNKRKIGLSDLVVDNEKDPFNIIFASHFDGISDIQTRPDSFLYVLSIKLGKLYRIVPLD
jgi:aldose sugar dehydrogenase